MNEIQTLNKIMKKILTNCIPAYAQGVSVSVRLLYATPQYNSSQLSTSITHNKKKKTRKKLFIKNIYGDLNLKQGKLKKNT